MTTQTGAREGKKAPRRRISRRLALCLPGLAGLALAATNCEVARADGYNGDFQLSGSVTPAPSSATTSSGTTNTINNTETLVNNSAYTANIASNTSTITNTKSAQWNGDLEIGANGTLGHIVNEGTWNGTLNNAGGSIDNSGTLVGSINNVTGIVANEGKVNGDLVNSGTATNSSFNPAPGPVPGAGYAGLAALALAGLYARARRA